MTALPLTTLISQQSTKTVKFRTKIARFGDGYSQRAADGINNKIDSWNIIWDNLTETEMDTIVAALDSVGGHDILTWTPFSESTEKKFILSDGYSFSALSGNIYKVSTTLEQVFDV